MPDPLQVIAVLEMAGVDSIVYTLRGESSDLVERDLSVLHHCIHTHFNLRIVPGEKTIQTAIKSHASMVTFIRLHEQNAESIDLTRQEEFLLGQIHALRQKGIIVNALIDPDAEQLKAAVRLHMDYIELNARRFILADNLTTMEQELENLKVMSMSAVKFNLSVMAGGDPDCTHLRGLRMINEIEEINTGHPLFNRSLFVGVHQAVKDFITELQKQ